MSDELFNEELRALLCLHFTPKLGARRIETLRQYFGTASAILAADAEAYAAAGLGPKIAQDIKNSQSSALRQAEAELQKIQQLRQSGKDIRLLGRGLPSYPSALEALSDPPPVLWVRGSLPELPAVPMAIGIVGTRGASDYALAFTRHLSSDLATGGVMVISGLARGIDTAAHAAALSAGGVGYISIAVVGHAVDRIYPAENIELARQLTLISEYPLGTGPKAHHFPQRNRFIAALSAGVVVVEGELKSGSLITATHALECGRSVFAVPGRAGDPRAAGPHRLLREGAVLTESALDIYNEMGWQMAASAVQAPLMQAHAMQTHTADFGTTETRTQAAAHTKPIAAQPAPNLPKEQAAIWEALTEARTLDDLCSVTQLGIAEVQTALIMLQMAGLAAEKGGRWVRG